MGHTESWYALALCLLYQRPITIEQALDGVCDSDALAPKKRRLNPTITVKDIQDMIKLREKMTFREIGEMYNIKGDAVFNRIKRYKGLLK